MSKGLGRVHRTIINVLQQMNQHSAEMEALTACVCHPERFAYQGETYFDRPPDAPGYESSRAEYVSVRRAVTALERRGLVQAHEHRVGSNRWTVVSLVVDAGDDRLRA